MQACFAYITVDFFFWFCSPTPYCQVWPWVWEATPYQGVRRQKFSEGAAFSNDDVTMMSWWRHNAGFCQKSGGAKAPPAPPSTHSLVCDKDLLTKHQNGSVCCLVPPTTMYMVCYIVVVILQNFCKNIAHLSLLAIGVYAKMWFYQQNVPNNLTKLCAALG